MAELTIRGSEELSRDIARVLEEFPDAAENEINKLGNKFRRLVIEKTPEKKGKLKKSYKFNPTQKIGKSFVKEFYSSAPHYHLIERGHIKKDKNGKELGFVPGVKMVERTVNEFNSIFEEEINQWLDKVIKGLNK